MGKTIASGFWRIDNLRAYPGQMSMKKKKKRAVEIYVMIRKNSAWNKVKEKENSFFFQWEKYVAANHNCGLPQWPSG